MKLLLAFLITFFSIDGNTDKVYICKSTTSYAYHKKICAGLKKCTHQVAAISKREAVDIGYKGYCYK